MAYSFNPSLGDVTLWALGRCGIRKTEITIEHLSDAAFNANLIFSDFSNDQPNLWSVDLQSVALTQAIQTYTLPAETVLVLSAYVRTSSNGVNNDRVIYGIGRDTYASYPNKAQQAQPSVFWFDRVDTPTITLYPVPDGNGPYTLFYYRTKQDADAALQAGLGTDLPYRFQAAFAHRLAAELAVSYAPDRAAPLMQIATATYERAKRQDREHVPMVIAPGLAGYYRR